MGGGAEGGRERQWIGWSEWRRPGLEASECAAKSGKFFSSWRGWVSEKARDGEQAQSMPLVGAWQSLC